MVFSTSFLNVAFYPIIDVIIYRFEALCNFILIETKLKLLIFFYFIFMVIASLLWWDLSQFYNDILST